MLENTTPAARRTRPSKSSGHPAVRRPRRSVAEARFCGHIIDSLRNGIIAIRRDGSMAFMNDEAYRILALTRQQDDIGRPFTEVLRERADAAESLAAAFGETQLSSRAEF